MKSLLLSLILMLMWGCTSHKEVKSDSLSVSQKQSTKAQSTREIILQFKPQIKPYAITKLSVESFMVINLSQLENQIVTYQSLFQGQDGNTLPTSEEETVEFDESNASSSSNAKIQESFFSQWHITQDDFAQFSVNHQSDIQNYLQNNKTVQNRLFYLEGLLSQIQDETSAQQEYSTMDNKVDQIANKTEEEE